MKVVLVELAIWVWWTALVLSVGWVCPLMADQENDTTTLRFNTITFNTEGTVQDYRTFIRDLINQLKGSETVNIPVLRETVPDNKRFLLVKLQAPEEKFVTLVVDVTTLYVLGYADRFEGKDRAHFFADKYDKAIPLAKRLVFQGYTSLDIPYGFSYGDLEAAALNTPRKKIPLGIESLQNYIGKVFGLAPAQKPKEKEQRNMVEAKFLLIAIQMVSEAARFKYIEINILGKTPDDCVIDLETSWDKLSTAIQDVEKLVDTFQLDKCPKLQGLRQDKLKNAVIKEGYMGILKYKAKKRSAIPIVSRIINDRYTVPVLEYQ